MTEDYAALDQEAAKLELAFQEDYAASPPDFDFQVGEIVFVQGTMISICQQDQNNKFYFLTGVTPPWKATIIKRWTDDDCEGIRIWYEVEPIEKPPTHRKSPFVVSECEIKRE